MRNPWFALLWKETQEAKRRMAIYGGGLLLFFVMLALLAIRGLDITSVGGLAVLIVFLFALIGGHSLMQAEWAGNHHIFLLTLPVPAWYLIGVKVAVFVFELVVYSLIYLVGMLVASSIAGATAVWMGNTFYPLPQALANGGVWLGIAKSLLILGGIYLVLVLLSQTVFIIGRLAPRRRGLVGLAGGFLFLWVLDRGVSLLLPLFRSLPTSSGGNLVVGHSFEQVGTILMVGVEGPLPLNVGVPILMVVLVLFVLVSFVMERRMQAS